MRKNLFFLTFIVSTFLLLQSCVTERLSANISVVNDIGNPVIVDFVFVFDHGAMSELQKMPSTQWFAKKDQYMLDWGTSKKIQVLSYELIAGQRVQVKHFKPRKTPLELVIYASYLSPGDHRIIIENYSFMELFLNRDDIAIKIPGQ